MILQTIFDMPSKIMILSSTEAIQKQKLKPIREASKHLSTRWGWMNESWFIPLPSSELTVGNAIIFLHRGCVIAQMSNTHYFLFNSGLAVQSASIRKC